MTCNAEDSVEKDVGLSVDGRESHLVFIDHAHGTMKLENLLLTYSPQAVLVVMAVDDIESFQLAEHILVYLTHNGYIEDKVTYTLTKCIFINININNSASCMSSLLNIRLRFNVRLLFWWLTKQTW